MSKKSRLKKQKENQTREQRIAELEELQEKREARYKESRAAKKLRRKAKKGYISFSRILVILIMFAAFFYSGFFYGGVTIVGSIENIAEFIPKRVVLFMAAGDLLMFIGLILVCLKKDKIQGLFSISGSLMFWASGQWIINDIQTRMENVYVEEDIANMDKQYMLYYYPILAVTLFSFIFLMIAYVKLIAAIRRKKSERDNAPVASIVDDSDKDG